jgi:hypothetical protein
VVALIVAVITTAFVIGGGGDNTSGGALGRPVPVSEKVSTGVVDSSGATGEGAATSLQAAAGVPTRAGATTGGRSVNSRPSVSVSATRVVKTGNLALTVQKSQVPATITSLVRLATSEGGYDAGSQMSAVGGSPSGEVTLRMPVDNFETTLAAAQKLGKQTSLSTNAQDVTGKFVDISARLHALQRTRNTYLTILGRARTIGQTLSVQQRVDDVQQQIEQLQGELKVLRNQSSDATLTVDVSEPGAGPVVRSDQERHGFGLAWHNSVDRFNRGLQAIVGALGPLLLAMLILGFGYVVARLGLRRLNRATT